MYHNNFRFSFSGVTYVVSYTPAFLFNTYFTSVYSSAMWLQCNRPITGAEGSYKASDGCGSLYHAILYSSEASLLQHASVATHLTITYSFPHIWLSKSGGCIDPTKPLAECLYPARVPYSCDSTFVSRRVASERLAS